MTGTPSRFIERMVGAPAGPALRSTTSRGSDRTMSPPRPTRGPWPGVARRSWPVPRCRGRVRTAPVAPRTGSRDRPRVAGRGRRGRGGGTCRRAHRERAARCRSVSDRRYPCLQCCVLTCAMGLFRGQCARARCRGAPSQSSCRLQALPRTGGGMWRRGHRIRARGGIGERLDRAAAGEQSRHDQVDELAKRGVEAT
jgi:hypothetical protein